MSATLFKKVDCQFEVTNAATWHVSPQLSGTISAMRASGHILLCVTW
ncbi:MAG: hypothetical protein HZA50_17945 [Planctomycetes bacterium]|nr:hypothetical protein [Planctomycetota bacterium]